MKISLTFLAATLFFLIIGHTAISMVIGICALAHIFRPSFARGI